jgi:peptidoglycan/xylan/chitin deacetylase (PgdA/CDA1 family)
MENKKRKILRYFHRFVNSTQLMKLYFISRRSLGFKHIPILVYHTIGNDENGVFNVHPDSFEKQIRFISANFKILRLKNIERILIENDEDYTLPSIVITFDDAEKSILTFAHEILVKYNIPYTIFIPTGSINKSTGWMSRRRPLMSTEELIQLKKSGLVDFGSHSINHVRMRPLGIKEMKREALESRKYLEKLLNVKKIDMFAYPYGGFDACSKRTMRVLKESGYRIGVTTKTGVMQSKNGLLNLKRILPTEYDDDNNLSAKLKGNYDWYLFKEALAYYGYQQFY